MAPHNVSFTVQVFADVCDHFTPALHQFFLESFRDPATWLLRRSAYTRSVAVTSMVGHVLGIGDRHGGNILLHTGTAQVVHIDLGIAFEQVRLCTGMGVTVSWAC